MKMTEWVDPFIGTEAIDLPRPEGLAATWFYLKAQIGNTHPGACLPCSPVSACPYSGAYVTGYGRYDVNTHGNPPKLYKRKGAFGVTHVHHSGTGYVGHFYNFLLTVPFRGAAPSVPALDPSGSRPYPLSSERARPGYYAGRLEGIGIDMELTVGRMAAAHRYVFPGGQGGDGGVGLAVDVTNGGLTPRKAQARPTEAAVGVRGNGVCVGTTVFEGVAWHFALVCPDGAQTVLWTGREDGAEDGGARGLVPVRISDARELSLKGRECQARRAGVAFRHPDTTRMHLYVGLSLASQSAALEAAERAARQGFDRLAAEADAGWEDLLGRIRVSGGDSRARRIFYTALYHSLLKPVETEGTNFLWKDGPALYAEFSTFWDQYKTALPLLFTVCPQRILPVVRSLRSLENAVGHLPAGLIFSTEHDRFQGQSRALPQVVLRDAYDRLRPGERDPEEWDGVLASMVRSLDRDVASLRPGGEPQAYSHVLDLAYGAFCTARIAADRGRRGLLDRLAPLSGTWRNAFEAATGMMKDGPYYEAGPVSYSFRLLHDMQARIGLCGGARGLVSRLDGYFGYGAPPVAQLGDPPWDAARDAGLALGRFDGINNEVALEAPFAYGYAGAPWRTAEIVDAVMRYQFNDSPGGLPGNDDSGALSSWYVWNATGLFPVPGQGIFWIGCPVFDGVEFRIGEDLFRIRAAGRGTRTIHLRSVRLNGRPLGRTYLRYDEVLSGGELDLSLGEKPGDFTVMELPPSYGPDVLLRPA
jgi:predicted alpha-1,2-mannosidase